MNKLTLTTAFSVLIISLSAQAETTNCTAITSLPFIITTQGVYCLTGNLNTSITSGAAISIATNNVVLDLNGFKLGGLSAGLGTGAIGIYAFHTQNITIKNGTVRGFWIGIDLDDTSANYTASQGHIVEDIRADQNTYTGLEIRGNGNIIRNNQVVATGGSTSMGVDASAFGIHSYGAGAQVLNNMVTQVTAQGTPWAGGIVMESATNSVVAGNRVSNLIAPNGTRMGVGLVSGSDIAVKDNIVSAAQWGIYFTATGKYMNNLMQGVTNPYTGGTAAGTTNY